MMEYPPCFPVLTFTVLFFHYTTGCFIACTATSTLLMPQRLSLTFNVLLSLSLYLCNSSIFFIQYEFHIPCVASSYLMHTIINHFFSSGIQHHYFSTNLQYLYSETNCLQNCAYCNMYNW